MCPRNGEKSVNGRGGNGTATEQGIRMKCAECGSDLSCAGCSTCGTIHWDKKIIVCIAGAHLCLGCYINAKLTEVIE